MTAAKETLIASDFAFLEGEWTVKHRRLKARLEGSTEWIEFETDFEHWSLLGGLANADRLWGQFDGKYFEGVSVRTYDQDSAEWTIYWMDTRFPMPAEQVRGRFTGGHGEFFGKVGFQGRDINVRFVWDAISKNLARWEQAYQVPESGEWETNWIMDFHRKPG